MLVDFKYPFLCGSFGLEICHTCYQHKDGLVPKISWEKNKNSTIGKVLKLAAINFFSWLHMLVDYKYIFCINFWALKFGTHVIDIQVMLCQKFHGQRTIFIHQKGVKVDSSEISFPRNAKTSF